MTIAVIPLVRKLKAMFHNAHFVLAASTFVKQHQSCRSLPVRMAFFWTQLSKEFHWFILVPASHKPTLDCSGWEPVFDCFARFC
jgi:hypothetical protein